MNKNTKYIATTGVMLALLVLVQFITKAFGQLITGSCVNFILAMTAFTLGMAGSITLAILSPFLAFLLGIGPAFLPIVPCIALGNLAYVILICLIKKAMKDNKPFIANEISIIAGAVLKFLILYIFVVKLVVPSLGLPEAKVSVISAMFSFPQLFTALIGGTLASVVQCYLPKHQ